jgi:hypothetical protein
MCAIEYRLNLSPPPPPPPALEQRKHSGGCAPPIQPDVKHQIGSGPELFHMLPFLNRSQRNRVGSTPSFFWLEWQHIRGASCVRCPPQFVPSAGGGGFTVPPRLGRPRDFVHVPTSVRSPICKCRAYSGPSPAARSRAAPPPVRTPQGPTADGGHASCEQAPGFASGRAAAEGQ